MNRIPHAAEIADRRDAPRVDLDGQYSIRLSPGDGREPLICTMLDYSVTGMRLQLPADEPLPDQVMVLIGEIEHAARIVWRNGSTIGVDFVDEHHSIY
jgi:hypothetical protein